MAFIPLSQQIFIHLYSVQGTAPNSRDAAMNKTYKIPALVEFKGLMGKGSGIKCSEKTDALKGDRE